MRRHQPCISDELLISLCERVEIISALAERAGMGEVVQRAALADIGEQAQYCRWLLAQVTLAGAA
jgi:hypothetical protein